MNFTALRRFGRSLKYGFQRELRPYEAGPFARVLAASPEPDRDALQQQFEARERIQRWGERILYFSLPPDHNLARIAARDKNYCYASVKLSSSHGKVTAKLMTHLGLLSTLEFSRSPISALASGFVIEDVALHPGGGGYAEEIQETEHGPISGT